MLATYAVEMVALASIARASLLAPHLPIDAVTATRTKATIAHSTALVSGVEAQLWTAAVSAVVQTNVSIAVAKHMAVT